MSGEQAIVDRIISEARDNAESIIYRARLEASSVLEEAERFNAELDSRHIERARGEADQIRRGRLKERELDLRRKSMAIRFTAMDEAFMRAKERLLSLSDAEYTDYIRKQIKSHASDGDEVIISKSEKRITKKLIEEIAAELKIGLSLASTRGDFSGGCILRGKYWDCNLTIESNLSFFRAELEPLVSKLLLGESPDE